MCLRNRKSSTCAQAGLPIDPKGECRKKLSLHRGFLVPYTCIQNPWGVESANYRELGQEDTMSLVISPLDEVIKTSSVFPTFPSFLLVVCLSRIASLQTGEEVKCRCSQLPPEAPASLTSHRSQASAPTAQRYIEVGRRLSCLLSKQEDWDLDP